MGTVLHQVTGAHGEVARPVFQSPSRWGRCCIAKTKSGINVTIQVFQSPSRWGRCCIWWIAAKPSRWGRCCICCGPKRQGKGADVSVPFSMGTVLHPYHFVWCPKYRRVSVPFSMGTVLHRAALAVAFSK